RLLDVEDFAFEREDRLRATVATLFCAVVNEDAAGQSEIVRSRHFKIVNVHPLIKTFDIDDAMVIVGYSLIRARLITVEIPLTESLELQQRFVERGSAIRLISVKIKLTALNFDLLQGYNRFAIVGLAQGGFAFGAELRCPLLFRLLSPPFNQRSIVPLLDCPL